MDLFAIPDDAAETNHYEIAIPLLGSLILTHDSERDGHGLEDFPADQRPPVAISLLRLPDHGRNRDHHAGDRRGELVAAMEGRLFDSLVPSPLCLASPLGFHRGDGRLGDDGSRPSALDGLRAPAHRQFRVAVADGDRTSAFAAGYVVVYLVMFQPEWR